MSEKLKEMSVAAFVDLTASDAPAPGAVRYRHSSDPSPRRLRAWSLV